MEFLLPVVEARAGGGGSYSSSGSSRSWSSSTSSGPTHSSDSDVYGGLGLFVVFALLAVTCNIIIGSRKQKNTKSRIEFVSKQLKNVNNSFWEEETLKETAKLKFVELQVAWSEKNLSYLRSKLEPKLFGEWKQKLETLDKENKYNKMSDLEVKNVAVVDFSSTEPEFTVCIDASALDQIISNGEVVGDQSGPFREFWSFVWKEDDWLLSKVYQENETIKYKC